MELNDQYWNNRYIKEETGWDIGHASPAIVRFIEKIPHKSVKILIPGCGHAYEGEHLFKKGYTNITLLDFSEQAKANFLERVPDFPPEQFIIGDFFKHEGTYDIIIEQTFFCAIDPSDRKRYAEKVNELTGEEGLVTGLLFDTPLNADHPPFGGCREEYIDYFSPYFSDILMERCYNSIEPRSGRELFFILNK